MTKKLHYFSGITLAVFISIHLFNHFFSIWGADRHIKLMDTLRHFYRNPFFEGLILSAVVVQIVSGFSLVRRKRKNITTRFEKIQVWTGLYLAFFLLIHVSAILTGRYVLHLDTNFYFGAAGLNTFPLNLFFIPYYGLSIVGVSGHVAAIHSQKMKRVVFGLTPGAQSKLVIYAGIVAAIVILYGFTNQFNGVTVPTEYNILIGK